MKQNVWILPIVPWNQNFNITAFLLGSNIKVVSKGRAMPKKGSLNTGFTVMQKYTFIIHLQRKPDWKEVEVDLMYIGATVPIIRKGCSWTSGGKSCICENPKRSSCEVLSSRHNRSWWTQWGMQNLSVIKTWFVSDLASLRNHALKLWGEWVEHW